MLEELGARVGEVPDVESVLTGLNDSQREAALALRGPVAILAGAGTGKTTTITRRIACQVRSGAFEASQILAVTFTEKAAGELKRRLDALGVAGRRGPDVPLGRALAALATLVLAHGRAPPRGAGPQGSAHRLARERACRRRTSSFPGASSPARSSGPRTG